MKNVRLFHSGTFVGESKTSEFPNSAKMLTRRARLVYEGEFDSMDGPVKVTKEHIEKLAAAHNEGMAKLSANQAETGTINMANFPPVQVDHSTSAHDTVGRVVGTLEVGEFEGKTALFGNLCFLGAENVERVSDGRWTHLSLGADLDGAKLNEMTVTPFPAAPKASLLSKGAPMDEKKMAALKKHLMEKEKLSEKEADDKLAAMSEEDKTKMSKEVDDKEKLAAKDKEDADKLAAEEKEEKEEKADKKMTAAKSTFAKLSKKFNAAATKATSAISKVALTGRLNSLRMQGKLSPAEQKEVDLDKLSALGKEAQDFFFTTYEKRSPIILAGVYGRHDATDITELAKDVKGKQMLGEMVEGMQFSRGVVKRLAGGMPTSMRPNDASVTMADDNIGSSIGNDNQMPTSMDTPMQMSAHFKHMSELMDAGKHDEVKEHLARCMEHCAKMGEPGTAGGTPGGTEGPAHLSALAENVQTLQNQFKELVELVTPILGE